MNATTRIAKLVAHAELLEQQLASRCGELDRDWLAIYDRYVITLREIQRQSEHSEADEKQRMAKNKFLALSRSLHDDGGNRTHDEPARSGNRPRALGVGTAFGRPA